MKKIIGIVACAALVATSAFAGVNVGGWGRSGIDILQTTNKSTSTKTDTTTTYADKGGVVSPTTSNGSATTDDDMTNATPMGGWAGGSRVGVKFDAASEDGNIGFTLNVDSNGGNIAIGDQAKIWAKLGFLKVQVGQIQLDDLRGSIGDWGSRDMFCLKGEDAIFPRFNPKRGMTVELRPVDGLFIGGDLDVGTSAVSAKTTTVKKNLAFGVGYTIADVMQIKGAYFGKGDDDTYNINAGVDLLMIPGNVVEIGVTIPRAKDNANGYANVVVALSGSNDAVSYKAHVFGDFVKATATFNTVASDPTIGITAGLDAAAEFNASICSIGVTGSYQCNFWNGASKTVSTTYYSEDKATHTGGLEVYAKKGFSNGYIFAGVADQVTFTVTKDTTKATETGVSTTTVVATQTEFKNIFTIPVGLEYYF